LIETDLYFLRPIGLFVATKLLDRIVSAWVKGMTFQQPSQSKTATAQYSVTWNGINRIFRASRSESARRR